jgi:iron complex transport system permease protein
MLLFWAWALCCAVFLLCMCFRYNAYYYEDKFIPLTNLKNLWLAVRLLFGRIFGTALYAQREVAIQEADSVLYYGALARLKITVMAFLAGGALAVSGAIFQTAYQNPMASPNIIGASAGVSLGNVLVVTLYSAAAVDQIFLRYKFCYGFTAICVAAVLLLGKLAGDKKENYSIMEMVMVGSIVSQVINVLTMYLMYQLSDEDLLVYQQLRMGSYIDMSWESMLIFFLVMGVSLIPVLLMRYRMNAIGMSRMETTALGINIGPLRLVGQLCGAVMVTCAMVHCGEIGMISMVIPYLVRQTAGSDFRKLCVLSLIAGGSLLMLCRLISSMIVILDEALPVTFLINLVLTPAFLIILARQGRNRH